VEALNPLTESYYPNPRPADAPIVIHHNSIGFNDFRGTELSTDLTPDELEGENDISRNLGYDHDRGRGSHPSVFSPGD
jgi:hypothetical protein